MVIHNPILTGSFTVNNIDVSSITSSAANITALNATTASLNSFSASVLSYTASQNILNGTYTLTSSFVAQTASFTAFTASILAQTASLNSFSASILSYTSSLNAKTASFATTGSNTFIGSQVISGSLTTSGSITSTSTITAQTLVVQTITSSVDFVTGSTRFGSILGNTHVFSGSVTMNPGGLFVSSSGDVGIGTTTPAYNLDVNGVSGFNSNITSGANVAVTATQNGTGYLFVGKCGVSNRFRVGPTGYVIVDENSSNTGLTINQSGAGYSAIFCGGNVGINCITPNYKLHINGCTAIDGNLRMGSGYSSGNSTDPGITVQGFTNAGMYFSNCGVGLGAGSSSKSLLLTSYGGVLIGTEAGSFGKLSVLCGDDTPISSTVWGTPGLCNSSISVYNTSQCVNSVAGFKLITRNSGASTWSIYNISTGASTGDLAFGHGSGGTGYELLRIVSSGNVGINNTTPCGKLQITLGTVAGGCFRTSAGGEAALTIEACGNSYLQFINCSTSQTGLMFGNNCTAYSGMIWYRHDQKQLMLGAGGTETVYICGGNVGIGISNPGATLDVYGTAKVAGVLTLGSSTSTSGLVISSNQTALKINGSTGYARGFLAFSWDITPDIGTIFGCSLGFNTNATVGTNAGTRALTIDSTGVACFSQTPSFPGATLTCTYTCTYSSYTAGCWLGLFAGDNGYNGAYAFTVVGQFNLNSSAMYSINFATVPYIHKSTSINATNGNDFYGIAHTSAGHADNGALVCFRRVRYSGNTPVGNRTEFCMNVNYTTSFTATTYVLAWV